MNKPIDNPRILGTAVSLRQTLKIHANLIGGDPVVLTHKPGTRTALQFDLKSIDEISVDFPKDVEANPVKITVELIDDSGNFFKTPLLTNEEGQRALTYPCISGKIDPSTNRKIVLTFTAHELIEVVAYKNLWLNTNEKPIDPTVIIKK